MTEADYQAALLEDAEAQAKKAEGLPGQAHDLTYALTPRPRTPSLVKGIVPAGSLNIWFGSPGSLKSNLLMDMAICVATGSPWLQRLQGDPNQTPGIETTQAPVVWVDVDNGEDITAERLRAFSQAYGTPITAPLTWFSFPTPPIVAAKGLEDLTDYILSVNARLIVMDNLLTISGVRDENASEMLNALSPLRQMTETTGASVNLLHHPRKNATTGGRDGDSLRGHGSIEGAIDYGFMIKRESNDRDDIQILNTKFRRRRVETFSALWTYELEADQETLASARFWACDNPDPKSQATIELKSRIINTLTSGKINQVHLREAVGGRKITMIDTLNELIRDGLITCEDGPRGERVYSIKGINA